MKLAIVRHGEAAMGAVDASRQLTEHGRQQAQKTARWLTQISWQDAVLMASPYVRAQQTAEYIASACDLAIKTNPIITPDSNPTEVIEGLINYQQDIIFVSHQPLVGYLASLLLEGQASVQNWQTAECWLLEGEVFAANCMELITKYRM